ncbi:MAG: chemotaxis protein CheW [Oscillospiraceae bacterium]|nr:chemotaxis protein CheW [Oscillospiraceae bacterium]
MNEDMLFATESQLRELDPAQVEETVDAQKFLILVTDDLKFGVDAEDVIEIITNHTITYLPMLPDFIRGIVNLRGQMIPIVDIRLHLGKPEKEDCLVIVLNIGGAQIGILVDSVDQMIDIPKADILPMPAHSVQKLVSGMCALPDGSGTMMVLDCGQLLPQ